MPGAHVEVIDLRGLLRSAVLCGVSVGKRNIILTVHAATNSQAVVAQPQCRNDTRSHLVARQFVVCRWIISTDRADVVAASEG